MEFRNLPRFNEQSYVHYITTKTFNNFPYFKDYNCCEILIDNFKFYRKKLKFKILGYIIMPDHFHQLIWWDVDKYPELTISKIIQSIKGHSGRQIIDYLKSGRREPLKYLGRREPLLSPQRFEQRLKSTHRRALEYIIWQPSFYDFNIYSIKKLKEKLDYLHQNCVRADLVKDAANYKYSSFRNYFLNDDSVIEIDILQDLF